MRRSSIVERLETTRTAPWKDGTPRRPAQLSDGFRTAAYTSNDVGGTAAVLRAGLHLPCAGARDRYSGAAIL